MRPAHPEKDLGLGLLSQMEASLEWRLWAGHPGNSSGKRVGQEVGSGTAEETCECASLGDTWAMWGATGPLESSEQAGLRACILSWHSWQHARSYTCSSSQQKAALILKRATADRGLDQRSEWSQLSQGPNEMLAATPGPLGWGDSCTVTQDIPRILAHSGPHRWLGDTTVASRQLHRFTALQAKQNHCGRKGLSGWGCGGPGHRQEKRGTYSSAWRVSSSSKFSLWGGKSTSTNLPTPVPPVAPQSQDAGMEAEWPQKRAGPETRAVPVGQEAAA